MTDETTLKPCPFCDGEAKITTCDLLDGDQWACVCCKVCNAQIVNEDEEDAITAWNTRQPTQSDALREENERLRSVLQRTLTMAELYAEGTGTNFNQAMAEARAALQEQSK